MSLALACHDAATISFRLALLSFEQRMTCTEQFSLEPYPFQPVPKAGHIQDSSISASEAITGRWPEL